MYHCMLECSIDTSDLGDYWCSGKWLICVQNRHLAFFSMIQPLPSPNNNKEDVYNTPYLIQPLLLPNNNEEDVCSTSFLIQLLPSPNNKEDVCSSPFLIQLLPSPNNKDVWTTPFCLGSKCFALALGRRLEWWPQQSMWLWRHQTTVQ